MDGWLKRSTSVYYEGAHYQMYTRGALASALNREVVTIRSWEQKGVLCHPPLRMPNGRWLYTRDQIDDLAALAEEEGILYPLKGAKISPRFVHEAHTILARLPKQGAQANG